MEPFTPWQSYFDGKTLDQDGDDEHTPIIFCENLVQLFRMQVFQISDVTTWYCCERITRSTKCPITPELIPQLPKIHKIKERPNRLNKVYSLLLSNIAHVPSQTPAFQKNAVTHSSLIGTCQ